MHRPPDGQKRQHCTAHNKIVLLVLCLCIITLPSDDAPAHKRSTLAAIRPLILHTKNMHSPFHCAFERMVYA
jgi:hypothetical protein